MKTKFIAFTLALLFGETLSLHLLGSLVPNGVTMVPYGNYFDIHVVQNPANGDYTTFGFRSESANTFSFTTAVDEGIRVFQLSPNDPVSLQSIQTRSYTELGGAPSYQFADGTVFFVGLYTGYNPWVFTDGKLIYTGIYTDPVFGWAQLKNNNGTIELLDSALAYGADGIYAGSRDLITIPEPSTLALAALGGLFLGLCRRRNSSPPSV